MMFSTADGSIYTLHDGRITHTWTLEDTQKRLRQLGLTDDA
ncbi:MAG: hypothetical protein ACRDN9_01355 [Streptosporangiaceae bacterium]